MKTYKITNYCNIKEGRISLNGKELYRSSELEFADFIKGAYKGLNINYPKFYKMDALCKLAMVGGSIILDTYGENLDQKMAVLLSNRSSCITIDEIHQRNIDEEGVEGVRPANFVYTLPNIALGEISIKYQLRSENSFFIFEDFNPAFLIDYSKSLIELEKSDSILCGWIEVNNNFYNGFLFTIEKGKGWDLNEENLVKLI